MVITDQCTGCTACYNICPFDAIEMVQNKKGFYEPKINESKCRNCGKCKKICPQINKVFKNQILETYASWTKNDTIRKTSTSGGIFSMIAENIIDNNGVVAGALFDNNWKVTHGIITNKEDLYKLRGSKYVQSDLGNVLKKVKEYLEKGKKVLFSGTACQVAGLKNYLEKDYKNLITIDVLCHGVPSPKIFEQYKNKMQKENTNIKDIKFRYKKPSWTVFSMKIDYDNGTNYIASTYEDPFIRAFLEDYITNETCSSCIYTGNERVSDITLADFWGYISEKFKQRNTEKGISLILINTEQGKRCISKIKENIVLIEKDFSEAQKGNQCLREPFKKNKNYKEFWESYFDEGYDKTFEKYIKKRKMPLKRKISLMFNDKAYLLPKNMRKKMIALRDKSK